MKAIEHPVGTICIYMIRNDINGKVYVGKTKCFRKRITQYKSDFKNSSNNRINEYLLNSMKKYGIENFTMSILQKCEIEDCSELELKWMLKLNSLNQKIGYNLRLDSSTGMIAHPKTVEKMRKNTTEQWAAGVRDGHSEKLAKSWAGDPDRKKNQSALMTKTLTKYQYSVTFPNGDIKILKFSELQSLGLSTVLSNFHRRKCDIVKCKGHIIERKFICQK